MRDFHNYKTWEKAHKFALSVYRITKSFPKDELFGIISQLRRAATSIPFNIAEGSGRRSDAEFAYFLNIAAGSASEIEEVLLISYDLEFMDKASYQRLNKEANDIKTILNKLIKTLHE